MKSNGSLKEKDHKAMDKMLGDVLDAYKSGGISKRAAMAGLAHVMAALDIGNTEEAVKWFNQEDLGFFKEVHGGLRSIE